MPSGELGRGLIGLLDGVGGLICAGISIGMVGADANMEGDGFSAIIIPAVIAGISGFVFAAVLLGKRDLGRWSLWNIAYLLVLDLAAGFFFYYSEASDYWFFVLILPILACVGCWRLHADEKRREQEAASREALQAAQIDEAPTSDTVYSNY